MQYALVQNNVVVNIIEADAAFAASIAHEWQHVAHADGAGIGWGWDGSAFVAPAPTAPTVPQSCTPAQGLIALYALQSITEEDIATAIAAIPDPVQRYSAQIGYTRAITWERTSATMQALAALLGLSESDLSTLFTYAAGVHV